MSTTWNNVKQETTICLVYRIRTKVPTHSSLKRSMIIFSFIFIIFMTFPTFYEFPWYIKHLTIFQSVITARVKWIMSWLFFFINFEFRWLSKQTFIWPERLGKREDISRNFPAFPWPVQTLNNSESWTWAEGAGFQLNDSSTVYTSSNGRCR